MGKASLRLLIIAMISLHQVLVRFWGGGSEKFKTISLQKIPLIMEFAFTWRGQITNEEVN